jgi:hypothetical protein
MRKEWTIERAFEEDAASNGARVLKRLHHPLDLMLTCMRWSVGYPLSLRKILGAMHASLCAWYALQHHSWFIEEIAGETERQDSRNYWVQLEELALQSRNASPRRALQWSSTRSGECRGVISTINGGLKNSAFSVFVIDAQPNGGQAGASRINKTRNCREVP